MQSEKKHTCYLSLTGLIEQSRRLSDVTTDLFPLINVDTYCENVRESLRLADVSESDDDISQYFEKSRTPSICSVFTLNSDIPSLTPILARGSVSQCNSIRRKVNLKYNYSHEILAAESCLENTKRECPSPRSHTSRPRMILNIYSIWFGCHVTYLPVSRKLKIEVEKLGILLTEYGRKKCSITAKACLLPGNCQKQKVSVFSGPAEERKADSAFFKGFSETEYKTMTIGVRVFLKKGVLKRQKLVLEFAVPLSNINFQQKDISWINHEEHY